MNIINNDLNNKFQEGKIYKIVCNITGKIYVGSTTKPLEKRLSGHKAHYNLYLKNKYHYVSSFEIFQNGNYYIELICNTSCTSRDELRANEGKYIRELKSINKNIAGRTSKEYKKIYRIKNLDTIKEQQKKYRADNAEKNKQYKNNKCECGGKYTFENKVRHCKTNKHQKYLSI